MPTEAISPRDLLVEYRDSNLVRQGAIPIDDLVLKIQPVYCGIGSWSLQLPAEHRAVPYLRTPGSGVIVTNLATGQTLLSGPTSRPTQRASVDDPIGTVSIGGLTDDRLLWDALAYPQPDNPDPSTQARSNDVRTGVGESLMRQYVSLNIGPAAPSARVGSSLRRKVVVMPFQGLGTTTTRSPRFERLGELLKSIALEQNLGFRLVQVGGNLEFQVYEPTDRTATIRLDIRNGTLSEQSIEIAPPELTRNLVAGQGEGVDRKIIQYTTPESLEAEGLWGLIIEEFKDQRNTNVTEELQAVGLERLNEAGFTKVALKATPANDQTMIFMTDFFLGDRVSVVIDGQEQPNSNITEAAIVLDKDGLKTAIAIGDIADFDSDSAIRQQLKDNTRRIEFLEKNVEKENPNPGIPFAMAAGRGPDFTAAIATGSGVTQNITFPTGRFTSAPILSIVPGNSARLQMAILSVTTTGASLRIDNFSGATASNLQPIYWTAVQMSESSSSG